MISNQNNKKDDTSIATYQYHAVQLNHTVYGTSSAFANFQQLRTELSAQYQREKHELAELNQRFRVFVDRVQQLESENAKYIALLAEYQPGIRIIGTESVECYLGVQSDLMTINYQKVDYELEFQLFQLQIGTYKQWINWKDEQRLKFEQDLNQSSSILTNLRTSYAELGREVESVRTALENTFQQHLRVTHDWCQSKKQTMALQLSVQALKNQTVFYKNLRSYSAQ
jgi:chromosome segregation ATPase